MKREVEAQSAGIAVVSGSSGAELVVTGDVEVMTFPVRRASKKTAVRFAVGEPGHRGTIWRLWANRDAPDVYLASRQTAGETKISLHQSGDWRYQIVAPDRPKSVHFGRSGPDDGRVLYQWRRPDSNGVGWTPALTIVLPGNQLSLVPNDRIRWDDVRWCPAPSTSETTELEVYLVKPGLGTVSHRPMMLEGVRVAVMDALELSSGEVVLVIALTGPSRPDELARLERWDQDAGKDMPPEDWDRSPELAPRRLFYGDGPAGCPRFYDLGFRE